MFPHYDQSWNRYQSINSIERNRYVPSLELALIFARIFNSSTDQIFQLENEK